MGICVDFLHPYWSVCRNVFAAATSELVWTRYGQLETHEESGRVSISSLASPSLCVRSIGECFSVHDCPRSNADYGSWCSVGFRLSAYADYIYSDGEEGFSENMVFLTRDGSGYLEFPTVQLYASAPASDNAAHEAAVLPPATSSTRMVTFLNCSPTCFFRAPRYHIWSISVQFHVLAAPGILAGCTASVWIGNVRIWGAVFASLDFGFDGEVQLEGFGPIDTGWPDVAIVLRWRDLILCLFSTTGILDAMWASGIKVAPIPPRLPDWRFRVGRLHVAAPFSASIKPTTDPFPPSSPPTPAEANFRRYAS